MQEGPSGPGGALCPTGPSVGLLFDGIAPTYDLLNHLLSLGRDFAWRRRVAAELVGRGPLTVVDLATGTGDLPLALLRHGCDVGEIVALDISEEMLAIARRKIHKNGFADRVRFLHDDATRTSLAGGSFDVVTMAFGIRNTPDAARTLDEIHRLLKPGGMAVILEFSLPRNRIVRAGYLAYLRFVVPLVGGLISGNRRAYRYLNESIEAFHRPQAFCSLMERAGFSHVQAVPLTCGVASIYSGSKC